MAYVLDKKSSGSNFAPRKSSDSVWRQMLSQQRWTWWMTPLPRVSEWLQGLMRSHYALLAALIQPSWVLAAEWHMPLGVQNRSSHQSETVQQGTTSHYQLATAQICHHSQTCCAEGWRQAMLSHQHSTVFRVTVSPGLLLSKLQRPLFLSPLPKLSTMEKPCMTSSPDQAYLRDQNKVMGVLSCCTKLDSCVLKFQLNAC